jgi:Tol biopolymer transport system component
MVDVERDAWSRFTFLLGLAAFPVWSPDSRQVMFSAGAPTNLYRKEAGGAGSEQRVTESPNTHYPADWSRDGRLVLYHEITPDTQRDLWVLPVTPDGRPEAVAKARPYLRTRFNEWGGRFSPEHSPRWVAYTSDESGRDEVYVQGYPEPRGKFQISTGGGRYPEWSFDGRELYYVSADGKLMAAGVRLGADSAAPSTPREVSAVRVVATNFASPYSVAPDGKRFLVRMPASGSQQLEVVANWPALLKQGAAAE